VRYLLIHYGCPVIKGGAQVAVYETFNVM